MFIFTAIFSSNYILTTSSLLKNIRLAFVVQLLIKLAWVFIIDRGMQNEAGVEVYGKYFSYLQLLTIVVMLADFGLHNYATLYLNTNEPQKLPSAFFKVKIFLVAIYLAIAFTLLVAVPQKYKLLFVLVVILQLVNTFYLWGRALLRGYQQYQTDAIVSSLDKALVVIFGITALLFFKDFINIYNFVFIQILSLGCSLVFMQLQIPQLQKINSSQLSFKTILYKSIPFGLLMVFMAALYRQDAYLLNIWHPLKELASGIYATAYRLLDAANIIGYIVAMYFFSYCAVNSKNYTLVVKVAHQLAGILTVISLIPVLFGLFGANYIASLLYHTQAKEVVFLIQFIMLVLPAIFLVHVYGTVLSATNQIKSFLIISILAWLINFISNYFFIHYFSVYGSLYAALITQYVYAAACYYLVVNPPKNLNN
jgi:O-antigen/teichoic acid export membrane protein